MMELWPFTNFHDLNLDWLISKWKTLEDNLDDIHASMDAAAKSAANALTSENNALNSKNAAELSANAAAQSAESVVGLADQVATNTSSIAAWSTQATPDANAELLNIRVAYGGGTYASAGDSVRNQNRDSVLKTKIVGDELITQVKFNAGDYAQYSGTLTSTYNTIQIGFTAPDTVTAGLQYVFNGHATGDSSCIYLAPVSDHWEVHTRVLGGTDRIVGPSIYPGDFVKASLRMDGVTCVNGVISSYPPGGQTDANSILGSRRTSGTLPFLGWFNHVYIGNTSTDNDLIAFDETTAAIKYKPVMVHGGRWFNWDASEYFTISGSYTFAGDSIKSFVTDSGDILNSTVYSNIHGANDITIVNERLWASVPDYIGDVPTGTNNIYIYDLTDQGPVLYRQISTDFGHLNTIDYDPDSDCLVFGNSSNDEETLNNWFAIVENPENLPNNATLAANATVFPVNVGYKVNAVFGDMNTDGYKDIILISNDGTTITKVHLDRTGNQLDGTYTTLESYTLTTPTGVGGAAYRNGTLYIGDGTQYAVRKWLDRSVSIMHKRNPITSGGTVLHGVVQGVCVSDLYMYTFINVAGTSNNYIFREPR